MSLDFAIQTFEHYEGAERAYAKLMDQDPDAAWLHELAFVERHHRGRIVVRGVLAGHYLDIDDEGDAIGRDTGVGALAGGLIGAPLGPAGFAAGLVAGGSIGGALEAWHIPQLEGELFDQIREHVPEGGSALLLLAEPDEVDAFFAGSRRLSELGFRSSLTKAQARGLLQAVADAPLAAVQPGAPTS
jgi:uncharacterized membrane protein